MIELELKNLNCANCATIIEEELQSKAYLKEVSFSFATKKLALHSELPQEELQKRIQVEVDKIEEGISVGPYKGEETTSRTSFLDLLRKHIPLLVGALLFTTALISPLSGMIRLVLYIAAYLLIGGDVALRAGKNILKGRLFDENFLMTLATMGAFALGEYAEAVAVMLFYKVGEGFQEYAVDQSRRSIRSLLNIKAEYANRLIGDSVEKVSPSLLEQGDHILIKPGEKVPVDGRILSGETTLETSALTGESLPREAAAGEEILSGSINLSASITVEVTKTFANSAVTRILQLVEEAAGKKAPTEQFITKFARIYTPIVVTGAVALALVPPLLGFGPFSTWASRALIFLVISCPCALVLSVPLGFFGGLGAASRQGILIKGGNYLEGLNQVDTYVFDKTGTLTKGQFGVEKVSGTNTLELAAQLEQHSNHPIALSILEAYGKEVPLSSVTEVKEYPGKGLEGRYKGHILLAGNARLMKEKGIPLPESDYPGSMVHVALEGEYQGTLFIADQIKEGAPTLVSRLKEQGDNEIVMLTGDQHRIASFVGKQLNLDRVHSELLPEDKLGYVENYISKGKMVLFAGDGINDAPVLTRAHIGVAMGGLGSDAAIEAADVVIMSDQPEKILQARSIASQTRKIVLENIIFALGIKLAFLALGALGMVGMFAAIFADVGVALLAVLNSMRILKAK